MFAVHTTSKNSSTICVLKWVGMRNRANKWGIACNIPSIGWNAKPAHPKRPFTRESFKKRPKNFSTKSEAANRKWSNLTDHCPNYFKIQWSFLSISLFSDCKLPNQTIVICHLYSYYHNGIEKHDTFFSFLIICLFPVKDNLWKWFIEIGSYFGFWHKFKLNLSKSNKNHIWHEIFSNRYLWAWMARWIPSGCKN